MAISNLASSIVDIGSIVSIGIGVALVVSLAPKVLNWWPIPSGSFRWPSRVGLTLFLFGLAYVLALPLMALFGIVATISDLIGASSVPPTSLLLPTVWGVGSWVIGEAVNACLLVLVFAASAWIGAHLRPRLKTDSFLASLNPIQYWFVLFGAATTAFNGAWAIVLRIVLVRIPSLQEGAASRGFPGFIAGFVVAIAALVIVALVLYWQTTDLEEDTTEQE